MSTITKDNKQEMSLKDFVSYIKSLDIIEVLDKCEVLDIDNVVGRKICCPFHDDDTPSLHFYEDNYHCFGCGAGGDVFNYIQTTYDLSFIQAVSLIADYYGKAISKIRFNPFKESKFQETKRLDQEWAGYLKNMETAPKEIQEGAKIFFPLEVGYDPEIRYYVLRMTTKANRTAAFTKRRSFDTPDVNKAKFPKWKHSKKDDSNIEECGGMYNLGPAVSHIRKSNHVTLVEGPKDCIPFIMEGKKDVVAISGTHNFKKLLEVLPEVDNITLSLDSDGAGKKGMLDLTKFLADSKDLSCLTFIGYNGLDPYDYYKENESIPEEKPILDLFSKEELREVYSQSSLFNKDFIVTYYSNKNSMTYSESESYFKKFGEKKKIKQDILEIDKLVKSKDPSAERKLMLKYGVNTAEAH